MREFFLLLLKLIPMLKRIHPLFKSFYVIALAVFVIWMSFFDSNDFFTLYGLKSKISDLESDKTYYNKKIDELKEDRSELLSNSKLLEKFARERYLMKKQSEDLYIVVQD